MPRGTTFLGWPFRWLSSFQVPEYVVQPTVVPTIDVGSHNPLPQPFRQAFVMAAGNNVVFLPGLGRAAQLNGASPPDPINQRGARRWLSLSCFSDTVLAAGDDYELSVAIGTVKHELCWVAGATLWPAGDIVPLIRGRSYVAPVTTQFNSPAQGLDASVYVPDPQILFLRLLSQAGGEVLTISGVFLEAETQNEPLPDMYA